MAFICTLVTTLENFSGFWFWVLLVSIRENRLQFINIHSRSFTNRSTLPLLSDTRVSREIFILFLNSVGWYGDKQYVLKAWNSIFVELPLTSHS